MKNNLRDVLMDAKDSNGGSMGDYTVLSSQNDPFRVDTASGHRDAQWFADAVEQFVPAGRTIHLRGLFYKSVGKLRKPTNNAIFENTEADWAWLSESAAKSARWLGYVPWDRIHDAKHAPPEFRRWRPKPVESYLKPGFEVTLPTVDDLAPTVGIEGFVGRQPYKLVIVGEKSSLDEVVAPIADRVRADTYWPTGEISDNLIFQMAQECAIDGRKLIAFYLSDCDPSGWAMPISLGRKLQAFKATDFPDIEFEVRHVALTPDQVREYGLPSTPLKLDPKTGRPADKRAAKWTASTGLEQTEVDAFLALDEDEFRRVVNDAVAPFFDATLERRVSAVRSTWRSQAQEAVDAQLAELGESVLAGAEDRLAEIAEAIEELQDQFRIDIDAFTLPELPPIPEPVLSDMDGVPSPLIDSEWGFADGSKALIFARKYGEVD